MINYEGLINEQKEKHLFKLRLLGLKAIENGRSLNRADVRRCARETSVNILFKTFFAYVHTRTHTQYRKWGGWRHAQCIADYLLCVLCKSRVIINSDPNFNFVLSSFLLFGPLLKFQQNKERVGHKATQSCCQRKYSSYSYVTTNQSALNVDHIYIA